jgi:hypothetical protein
VEIYLKTTSNSREIPSTKRWKWSTLRADTEKVHCGEFKDNGKFGTF